MKREFCWLALSGLLGACLWSVNPAGARELSPDLAGAIQGGPAVAQAGNGNVNTSAPARDDKKYDPCGILFGNEALLPGEPIGMVFGVVGPPDAVEAKRSKSGKATDDYVNLIYYDRFVVHINSDNNIETITVDDPSMNLRGVPFKIGAKQEQVKAAWGEPSRIDNGFLCYWHRGVFVKVDKAGVVERISFSLPGKIEEDKKPKTKPATQEAGA